MRGQRERWETGRREAGGWLVVRPSGVESSGLVDERVWQPMRADRD
jgi:hypothetical protein